MNFQIRPLRSDEMDELIELSLLAWEPVFRSFRQVLGTAIYTHIYPDWRKSQAEVVESGCRDVEKNTTWVADVNGRMAGYVIVQLNEAESTGEIYLLAVHPDFQNRGIGAQLNLFALDKMRESGMKLAVVSTGGDPGHAPARRAYEKAGFRPLPIVRYYKDLNE